MNDFLEDIFDFLGKEDEKELSGKTFQFRSRFKIIESNEGYKIEISKLFTSTFKEKEEMVHIMTFFPMSVSDISGIELDDFKINKIYDGFFQVNYYSNKTFDLFFLSKLLRK